MSEDTTDTDTDTSVTPVPVANPAGPPVADVGRVIRVIFRMR